MLAACGAGSTNGTVLDAGHDATRVDAAIDGSCPASASTLTCPPREDPGPCTPDADGGFPAWCPESCAAVIPAPTCPVPAHPVSLRVLLFTRFMTPDEGGGWYPHPAHCVAEKNLAVCGQARGWTVTQTRDPSIFASPQLASYDVVVFAMTNGTVLDAAGQAGLQAFVRSGKGFAGLHSSSATFMTLGQPYSWPWYGQMLGGGSVFSGHPDTLQTNPLHLASSDPVLTGLPDPWVRCEETYSHDPNPEDDPNLQILLRLDESCPGYPPTYRMGGRHPLSWKQTFEGGRVFYTALGHAREAYYEQPFLEHVGRGIEWAAGH